MLNNPLKYTDPSGLEWYEPWTWGIWDKIGDFFVTNNVQIGVNMNGGGTFNAIGSINGQPLFNTGNTNISDPAQNVNADIARSLNSTQVYGYDADRATIGGDWFGELVFWTQAVPMVGASLSSGENLNNGNYLMAGLDFGYAVLDVFTIGWASKYRVAVSSVQTAAKGVGLADDAVRLTSSSGSLASSRTYSIYNRFGELHKFGVTDAKLVRYGQSLKQAGPGTYGKYSSVMYKGRAHAMEKYLRSLQFNSTGQYTLPGMKVPYPVNFNTGLPIKP